MSMSELPYRPQARVAVPAKAEPNYLNAGYGLRSWLLTTDHKRIAHPVPGLGSR